MQRAQLLYAFSGAILAGLAVAAGALGAHALAGRLDPADLDRFETAVRYQMFHSLALLGCACLPGCGISTRGPSLLFLLGIALFCGGLYGFAFTHWQLFAHLAPVGGFAFLAGWGWLAGNCLWATPNN